MRIIERVEVVCECEHCKTKLGVLKTDIKYVRHLEAFSERISFELTAECPVCNRWFTIPDMDVPYLWRQEICYG